MYTIFQDMYYGDRTHISLTSKGRNEFRKDVAKYVIVLGLMFIVVIGMITQTINLKTAERDYANQLADVRSSAVQGWKLSIAKYK